MSLRRPAFIAFFLAATLLVQTFSSPPATASQAYGACETAIGFSNLARNRSEGQFRNIVRLLNSQLQDLMDNPPADTALVYILTNLIFDVVGPLDHSPIIDAVIEAVGELEQIDGEVFADINAEITSIEEATCQVVYEEEQAIPPVPNPFAVEIILAHTIGLAVWTADGRYHLEGTTVSELASDGVSCDRVRMDLTTDTFVSIESYYPPEVIVPVTSSDDDDDEAHQGCERTNTKAYTQGGWGAQFANTSTRHDSAVSGIEYQDSYGTWRSYWNQPQRIVTVCEGFHDALGPGDEAETCRRELTDPGY